MNTFKAPLAAPKRKLGAIDTANDSNHSSKKRKVTIQESSSSSDSLEISVHDLQKSLLNLEKSININLEDRVKYASQPENFMESEVNLDEQIKKLEVVAANPKLFSEFVRLNGLDSLLGLISHENPDIVADVISLLSELTDPENFTESEDSMVLYNSLIEKEFITSLVEIIDRFNENDDDEAKTIHTCLEILENLIEISPETSINAIATKTKLLNVLLRRISETSSENSSKKQVEERSMSPIKLYASEMLTILLQLSQKMKEMLHDSTVMDKLLLSIAFYRDAKPSGIDEQECLENMFDALCHVLIDSKNQEVFLKLEGIELLLLMMKERKFARQAAIKTVSYALMNNPSNCNYFIENGGLKLLFAVFVQKENKDSKRKKKKNSETNDLEDKEHLISIITSLLRGLYLQKEEGKIQRIVAKFEENKFEKLDELLDLFFTFYDKVKDFDESVLMGTLEKALGEQLSEDEIYIERLDAGLFVLQQICIILGFICGTTVLKKKIEFLILQKDIEVKEIAIFLKEYAANFASEHETAKVTEENMINSLLQNLGATFDKIQ